MEILDSLLAGHLSRLVVMDLGDHTDHIQVLVMVMVSFRQILPGHLVGPVNFRQVLPGHLVGPASFRQVLSGHLVCSVSFR
jgi:hypothetical protein